MSLPKPYYEEPGITIYCGDCRTILPHLPQFDLVLTDPPYGLGNDITEKKYDIFSDRPSEVKELVLYVLNHFKGSRIVITPGQSMMFEYPVPAAVGSFFYPAGNGSCAWGFVGWQPIFYYGKDPYLQNGNGRAMNSYRSTEAAEKNGHPCAKPIKQWSWLLNRSSIPGETILDPFMGSGTTLVAAKLRGRRAVGIEISEKYCEIAVNRLRQGVLITV